MIIKFNSDDKKINSSKTSEAEEFLRKYILLLPDSIDGILKAEWIENLDLPEELVGGYPIGSLPNLHKFINLKQLLKKNGFKETSKNVFIKIRPSGNQVLLNYDIAPTANSIICRLTYKGINWKHSFFILWAKRYQHHQYGINSVEQLQKALINHIYILNKVEQEILDGLDRIYGSSR